MQEHRVIKVPIGLTETAKVLLEQVLPLLKTGKGDRILYIPEIRTQTAFFREVLLHHLGDEAATLPKSLPLPNLLAHGTPALLGADERVLVLQVLAARNPQRLDAVIPKSGHLSIPYAQKILRLFDDLRTYLFPLDVEAIQRRVAERLETYPYVWERAKQTLDFLKLYRAFLYEKNLLDPPEAAIQTLEQGGPDFSRVVQGVTVVLIDGWTHLSPLQAEIVRRFLHHVHQRDIQVVAALYDVPEIPGLIPALRLFEELRQAAVPIQFTTIQPPDSPKPKAYAFAHPEDEARFVARSIKTLLMDSTPAPKILITMPSVYSFDPILSRIFLEYGLTYGRQFGPAVTQHPFVRFLLSAIRVIQGNYMRLPMVDLFTSPFFKPFTDQNELDALTLAHNLIGTREQWHAFLLKPTSDSEAEFQLSIDSRQILNQFLEWASWWETSEERPLSQHLSHLREFLERFADLQHVEPLSVLEIVAHALATLDGLVETLEDPELSLQTFYNLLFTVLRNQRLPEPEIPPPEFPIQVVGFEQVYHIPHDILFVLNMDEHAYPQDTADWLLLPDYVRRDLGLPYRDMLLDQQELRLQAVLKSPRQSLYVSYTTQKDDHPVLPCVFLDDLEFQPVTLRKERRSKILSPVELRISQTSSQEAWDFYRAQVEFDQALIEKSLRHRLDHLRVTDLEKYAHCPRRFFYGTILGLEELKEPEPDIEHKEEGNWFHTVMQLTFTQIREQGGSPLPEEEYERIYTWVTQEATKRTGIPYLWHRFLQERYREPFRNVLNEYADSGFRIKATEDWIEGRLPSGVRLRGRIDRIDVDPEGGVRIIDYKTGTIDTVFTKAKEMAERGELLQLPIYVSFYEEHTGSPGVQMLYFGWKKNNKEKNSKKTFTSFPIPNPTNTDAPIEEIVAAAIDKAEEIVQRIQNAEFPPEPMKSGTCNKCSFRLICPSPR